MSSWIEVGSLEQIPKLGACVVETEQGDIAVFRAADDHVFALHDRCPHKDGPLSQGIVHGHTVACPLHNWNIDLASGEAKAPDEGCAGRYDVLVEKGIVYIAL